MQLKYATKIIINYELRIINFQFFILHCKPCNENNMGERSNVETGHALSLQQHTIHTQRPDIQTANPF